jgi:hypothetical protein
MQITGTSGTIAEVNDRKQVLARAVNVSAIHEAALLGNAFSWNAISADIDAGDTALLVRNDSGTKYLVIEKIYIYSDVATAVDVHLVTTSFTAAGTAVTAVALNKSKSATADATAYADETGNTQGDIIVTLHTQELTTAQQGFDYDLRGAVILGDDQAIGVDIVAEGVAFECTIFGYFIDK